MTAIGVVVVAEFGVMFYTRHHTPGPLLTSAVLRVVVGGVLGFSTCILTGSS